MANRKCQDKHPPDTRRSFHREMGFLKCSLNCSLLLKGRFRLTIGGSIGDSCNVLRAEPAAVLGLEESQCSEWWEDAESQNHGIIFVGKYS